jgi:hypothetical protein
LKVLQHLRLLLFLALHGHENQQVKDRYNHQQRQETNDGIGTGLLEQQTEKCHYHRVYVSDL